MGLLGSEESNICSGTLLLMVDLKPSEVGEAGISTLSHFFGASGSEMLSQLHHCTTP